MAYHPPINRINYWSDPDIVYENVQTGTAEHENNARVLLNAGTTIKYDIAVLSHVRIIIYDLMGRKIIEPVDEAHEAGFYSAVWNGKNKRGSKVASGQYMYRVTAIALEDIDKTESHISTSTMHFIK